MNLRSFFESEKSRVFVPDSFFTKRVMARFRGAQSWKPGIWEMLPRSARQVLAIALVLIVCFVAVELFIPPEPQRGIVESVFESEQSPVESLIYSDVDVPARQVVLQQLIVEEDEK